MKGQELKAANEHIERVLVMKHYRPESAHRAVGAVLAYLGARRLAGACDSPDQRLVRMLAEVEEAAILLDAIPQRTELAAKRAEHWGEVCAGLTYIKVLLDAERRALRGHDSDEKAATSITDAAVVNVA